MEKAIIVGAYEFLGFHFCKKFLEQGIVVEGIHVEIEDKELFIEEKKMEIGRNANFIENRIDRVEREEKAFVIIDFYDFFMRDVSYLFSRLVVPYLEKMKKCTFVLLLPLAAKKELFKEELIWKEKLMKDEHVVASFYLPTVYGPWQPLEMVFQQILLKKVNKLKRVNVSSKEWVYDALYVEDIVDYIIEETVHMSGEFILTSGMKNMWNLCAKELSFLYQEEEGEPNISINNKIVVPSKTPYQEGLANQRRNVALSHFSLEENDK